MKIKVLIARQDTYIKKELLTTFMADQAVTVVISAFEWDELSKNTQVFQPDIILFPVHDFCEKVIEQMTLIKKTFPGIKTLLFMLIHDERFINEGLGHAVDGFLLNHEKMDAACLVKNIYDLQQNQFVLSGEIAKTVMEKILHENKKEQLKINLFKQQINVQQWELDFLYLLLKGYSDKKIALLLQLKDKTIFDYLSHSYRKFNIYGRDEMIAFLEAIISKQSKNI